jgi:hypothetical protein
MKTKSRICRALLVVALLVPLSGCPTSGSFTLGLWLFSIMPDSTPDHLRALVFLADGQTMHPSSPPPQTSNGFARVVTWSQRRSTITLTQDISFNPSDGSGPFVIIYSGTVDSDTLMSGTYQMTVGGNATGTWSAQLLP